MGQNTSRHSSSRNRNSQALERRHEDVDENARLLFHPLCGENIQLTANRTIATRKESFCKAIAFSNRPVHHNEKVYIRFCRIASQWNGVLRFGFSMTDPNSVINRGDLPKYVCPDMTNKVGNWAKALNDEHVGAERLLVFWVNPAGEIHHEVDGDYKGIFLNGVNTSQPLWAVFDVYGNTTSIKIECPPLIQPELAGLYQEISMLNMETAGSRFYASPDLSADFQFHSVTGRNVALREDRRVANRLNNLNNSASHNGYVFSKRPLRIDETVVVKVGGSSRPHIGGIAFGVTTCDPGTLRGISLPDDSDSLLDRPEYWAVCKNTSVRLSAEDELVFKITSQGEIKCGKNGEILRTIMHVVIDEPLWAFFDLLLLTEIRLLGVMAMDGARIARRPLPPVPPQRRTPLPRPFSMPNNQLANPYVRLPNNHPSRPALRSQVSMPETFTQEAKSSSALELGPGGSVNSNDRECVICCEDIVDCALYTCGHLCMCFKCATKVWKETEGICPMCRRPITDVIKIYKS